MSSYLNIYLKEKDLSRPKLLVSFSRNHWIYQLINEVLNPTYIGDENVKYSELTPEGIEQLKEDIEEEIKSHQETYNNKVAVYKDIDKTPTQEDITYLTEVKAWIKEAEEHKQALTLLESIVEDTNSGYNNFEKVLMNIE